MEALERVVQGSPLVQIDFSKITGLHTGVSGDSLHLQWGRDFPLISVKDSSVGPHL